MDNIWKISQNNLELLLKDVEKTHKEYTKSISKLDKNITNEIEKSLKWINNYLRVKFKCELRAEPSNTVWNIDMNMVFIEWTKTYNSSTYIQEAFYDPFGDNDPKEKWDWTIIEIANFLLENDLFKDSKKMKESNLDKYDPMREIDEFQFDVIEDLQAFEESKELQEKLNKLLIPHLNSINKIIEKYEEIWHEFELQINWEKWYIN